MKILTIIIPSYNTEMYMDECLPTITSIKNIEDLEILLINDGSKDGTFNKALQYQKLNPSSIRVIDKENGGHGSVINRGIKEAKGKYVKVIDGDDWVISNELERLVENLKTIDVDLVLNPYVMHNIVSESEKKCGVAKLKSGEEYAFDEIASEIPLLALHGITYRTSMLRENRVRFQEKCFYEDAEYYIYPVQFISNVMYFDFPVYIYRIGSVTQSVNPQNAIRNKKMLERIVNNLIGYYIALPNSIKVEKKNYIKRQITNVIKNMYGLYLKMPVSKKTYEELKEFDYGLMRKSDELYDGCSSFAVRLLRLKVYYVYVIGYRMFKLVRKIRGF